MGSGISNGDALHSFKKYTVLNIIVYVYEHFMLIEKQRNNIDL